MPKPSNVNKNNGTSESTGSDELSATRCDWAERAVIGGCLVRLDALDAAMEIVKPTDFYSERTQTIFAALAEMRAAGRGAIDMETVADWLNKQGRLSVVGGADGINGAIKFIMRCADSVPHAAHVQSYANQVAAASKRRLLEHMARDVFHRIPDSSITTEDIIADADAGLRDAIDHGLRSKPMSMAEILVETMAAIGSKEKKIRTLPTGLYDLDEICGGLQCGGMTVLAARPSAGKTAMSTSVAVKLAQAGYETMMVSYEQPFIEVSERFICNRSGLCYTDMHRNRLHSEYFQVVLDTSVELSKLPIWIDCNCFAQGQLLSMLRANIRKHSLKVVIIDYLQLIEPDDRRANREQQVAGISRALKRLAMQTDVAMLVLSQLNREVERRDDKRPRLADLRESGSIEQDADVCWLLYRPNVDSGDDSKPDDFGVCIVAKQRNGPLKDVPMSWHPQSMTYSDHSGTGFSW